MNIIIYTLSHLHSVITKKKDDIILVKCETLYDFSCHYVSKYDENPRINECVEITKDIFLKEYQVFINHIQKYLDNN